MRDAAVLLGLGLHLLALLTGQRQDQLGPRQGLVEREAGRVSAAEMVGMGMTLGVAYTGFEVLKVWLSNNDNALYVESTHAGVTFIDLGDETPVVNGTNDVVNISSISGTTTIDAGQGNDVIRVNFDNQGAQTFRSGIDGELTLRGEQGSDRYEIGITSVENGGGISRIVISSVNGKPVDPTNVDARDLAEELAALDPTARPSEVGTPWRIKGEGFFTEPGLRNRTAYPSMTSSPGTHHTQ